VCGRERDAPSLPKRRRPRIRARPIQNTFPIPPIQRSARVSRSPAGRTVGHGPSGTTTTAPDASLPRAQLRVAHFLRGLCGSPLASRPYKSRWLRADGGKRWAPPAEFTSTIARIESPDPLASLPSCNRGKRRRAVSRLRGPRAHSRGLSPPRPQPSTTPKRTWAYASMPDHARSVRSRTTDPLSLWRRGGPSSRLRNRELRDGENLLRLKVVT